MLSSAVLGVLLSGGSVMDVDGSAFVQLGIFFAAFFILKSLVFKPVLDVFDARQEAVVGARDKAETMETEAEAKRHQFEAELRKVRQTANTDREKLRDEAGKLARQLLDDTRRRTQDSLGQAKTRLDAEADKARADAQAQIPGLARDIAGKLLGRSVN